MKLPEDFLQSLDGITGFNREAFEQVHAEAQPPTSIRINEAKTSINHPQPTIDNADSAGHHSPSADHCELAGGNHSPVPWCQMGFYLRQRPSFTFDPLFHAGCYYVQEASSMFLEQALLQLIDLSQPLKALDLCAAPGGKSTHIQSLLSPGSLVVSNEVIKQRSLALTDNIMRWGCSNAFVVNNDPKAFQKLPGYFNLLVVDAPCSGSGLFRKDAEAVDEWSLHNVALCSQRQQRILADALPALKVGGLLVYSTCSYSREEDEAIMDWLVEEMSLENLGLSIETFDGIVETSSPRAGAVGYRFYPDKLKGEGFFLSCFRKNTAERSNNKLRPLKAEILSVTDKKVIAGWMKEAGFEYLRFRQSVYAVPDKLLDEFFILSSALNIQYAGMPVGDVLKGKLVPHHALALSTVARKDLPALDLTYDDAIRYLQRQELSFQPQTTGWQAVRYNGYNLGWVNVLQNRVNNYYPKEIRILKQHNNTAFEK
ncbi:MAG TPA: hypothetical protein VM871_12250 [Flavisolibacter sp.]|nr:hypothetical protein [Flavisolibacter sp.]